MKKYIILLFLVIPSFAFATSLSQTQINAILGLLTAFNAPQSVISEVSNDLNPQIATSTFTTTDNQALLSNLEMNASASLPTQQYGQTQSDISSVKSQLASAEAQQQACTESTAATQDGEEAAYIGGAVASIGAGLAERVTNTPTVDFESAGCKFTDEQVGNLQSQLNDLQQDLQSEQKKSTTTPVITPVQNTTSTQITSLPITVSCFPSQASTTIGSSITWIAEPSDINDNNNIARFYSWSGDNGLTGTGKSISWTYSATGTKSAEVMYTNSNDQTTIGICSESVNVTLPPPLPPCIVGPKTIMSNYFPCPSGISA